MDDRYMITAEFEQRLRKQDDARAARRRRDLIAQYGTCSYCGAPRDIATSTPQEMRVRCSVNPAHDVTTITRAVVAADPADTAR